MKRVLIYIRVSTSKQDKEGYSIPMQKERLIAYCKAKGWVISGVYVDPGYSGASMERPGLESMIQAAKEGKGDIVLVYKLDRLSRSQKDTLYLIEDVFMANNIDFVSVQESFDTTNIYGRAMVGILSVFAQMERETISERTMTGRIGRTEKGLWRGGGDWPIGYDYKDEELVINKPEAEQVRMVYQLYADGYSVTEISRRMNGYTTKHGDWSHTATIGNVLDNPLYAGIVHFDGIEAKGQHAAIIPAELNNAVKAKRERLRKVEASGDSNYLLTGIIHCAACGARYFPNRRPNGSIVYSCHSRAKKNRKMVKNPACIAPHIPLSKLDSAVEEEVLRLAKNPALIDEMIKKRATGHGSSLPDMSDSERIRQLDQKIGRLMDLYQVDDLVNVGEIAEQLAKLHAERVRLAPSDMAGVKSFDIEAVKGILRDVRHGWSEMDIRGRRMLLIQLIDKIHINAGGIGIEWSF